MQTAPDNHRIRQILKACIKARRQQRDSPLSSQCLGSDPNLASLLQLQIPLVSSGGTRCCAGRQLRRGQVCRRALRGGSACRHKQVSQVHPSFMSCDKNKGGILLTSRARTQGTDGYRLKKSSPREGRATGMSNAIFNHWQVAQIPEKFCLGFSSCFSGQLLLM